MLLLVVLVLTLFTLGHNVAIVSANSIYCRMGGAALEPSAGRGHLNRLTITQMLDYEQQGTLILQLVALPWEQR